MVHDGLTGRLTDFFVVYYNLIERGFWLFNHEIWWLKNENNFGEIVFDYGYKPIQIGDN